MQKSLALSACVLMLLSIAGCGGPPKPAGDGEPAADSASDSSGGNSGHSHGAGPHGGTLADWGGGAYHIEFTVDHDKKESAVYILGGDAKTPAPVKAEKLLLSINEPVFQVELAAQPLDGETDGMSSRFSGTHDNLGIVQEFAGTITGEVEGTPYVGEFKEEPHADH